MNEIRLVDICKALSKNEFAFYYQPIVSLITGKICSLEALIRWRKPDGSIIMPARFIPLAVEKGLITDITLEMYPKLIDDLARISTIDSSLTAYINLTTADLETDRLAERIGRTLREKGVSANQFGIEIVESVLMPPNPRVERSIFEFHNQGMPIVLDDFSAGNSTLNHLSQLPLTALKLALNIVQRAPFGMMDFRVLRHLVSLGHQLNLDVIAEGIEDRELYDIILSTGCSAAQGFYFSYPIPLDELLATLQKPSPWSRYPFGLEYLGQIDHIDLRRDVIRETLIIYTQKDETIRQRALRRLPGLEATECMLGEWYYKVGQEWHDEPGFEAFGDIHKEFHETAKNLVTAALNGESWREIERLVDEMTRQSGAIMQYLQQLAKVGLLENYQSPQILSSSSSA